MKNIVVHTLLGACAALSVYASHAQAQGLPHLALAKYNIPVESPGHPYYAHLSSFGDSWMAPGNDEWTVIIFYRDPACIPAEFDMSVGLDFPGPQGLGFLACPATYEGYQLHFSSPDPFLNPDYLFMRNSTLEMPMWFVSTRELRELFERGFFQMADIETLPSRVSASAWQFEAQMEPYGFNPELKVRFNARGRLETGGQFSFFWYNRIDVPNPFDLRTATELERVFELQADLPTTVRSPRVRAYECVIYPELPGCRD